MKKVWMKMMSGMINAKLFLSNNIEYKLLRYVGKIPYDVGKIGE